MAHKTSIGGTAYDIGGGKTLVEGTSYSVKNGKVLIDGTEYDISFLLPATVLDLWSGDNSNSIFCITYANGYWVVGGRYIDEGNDLCYARIAYATSLDGNWTIRDLWSSLNEEYEYYDYHHISDIAYGNGYWVVSGYYAESSADYARIAYATSLSGTWTIKDLWGDGDQWDNTAHCVIYANGYWVVGGKYYNGTRWYGEIAYATRPSGSWTTDWLWRDSGNYDTGIYCITYADGYWVVGGEYYDSGDDALYARIAYTSNLSRTWTTKDLWNSSDHRSDTIFCITYTDGYWVVGGGFNDKDNGACYARIAYATSPGGDWTIKDIWSGGTYYNEIRCIAYGNGYWMVGGRYCGDGMDTYARIAYATSLSGPWTIKDLCVDSHSDGDTVYSAIYADNYWVVGGRTSENLFDAPAFIAYSENIESFG